MWIINNNLGWRFLTTRSQLLERKTFFSIATATAGLTLSWSHRVCFSEPSKRVPPRFGLSVLTTHRPNHDDASFSSSFSLSNIDTNNKNDCPICKKFSQGPCGELFKAWMACTDKHPGKNPDKPEEDLHLSKCLDLVKPLGTCLEEHTTFYEELDVYAEDYGEEQGLMEAWKDVIAQVEKDRRPALFPTPPQLEIRLASNTGMASFDYELLGKNIVMSYVKDADSGELLAAGSVDDLWEYQGKGILRLSFGPTCKSVTTFALYMDDDETDILYQCTQAVPRS